VPKPPETWASANARKACLSCGASGARTFRLQDGRTVRACDTCLHRCDYVVAWLAQSLEEVR